MQNLLLAALPAKDYEQLLPQLELIEMELGKSLYESGGHLQHVFFPIEGIVSLLYVTQGGNSAELAVVGSEGMIGISLFMGGETTPNRAVVQSACKTYRLPAHVLKERFAEGGALHLILLKYTQALITQISQTAVCNLHHSVDQQLCRWLLLSLDRLPENKLQMTQELIANMLGVRRQGVTESARKLEHDGLITYKRGLITVLDRPGLEKRSCECYSVVRAETERLLPKVAAR
jgi:CRP-like cAMP-binding protein